MLPKHDELVSLCLTKTPDIVCLVEMWLNTEVLDNEVAIPNYSAIDFTVTGMVALLLFMYIV